jgi:hypothetical protein
MLLQFDQNIKEAKRALKNKNLMTKKEVSYWLKQIKTNEQKKKLFKL